MSTGDQPITPRLTQRAHSAAICPTLSRLEFPLPQLSLHSPVGDLTLSEEDGSIVALDWGWGRDQEPTPALLEARRQLNAYFDAELSQFTLALAPFGTQYRRRVWQALCEIPAGQTRTYAGLAEMAGGGARAIGGAMACNPIPILIPCHRVVASSGLGGYSGGEGLQTKRFLLALEQRIAGSIDLLEQPTRERT